MSDAVSKEAESELISLTSQIVAAYARQNQMQAEALPELMRSVHSTLSQLANGTEIEMSAQEPATANLQPAVPVDASVKKDAVACLECGKTFKTLKRHLSTEHQLTPAEYKSRWQLSKDYPLVAPSYSAKRAKTAKAIGLGKKPAAK